MYKLSFLAAGLGLAAMVAGCAPLGTYSRFQHEAKPSQFATLGFFIPGVPQARQSSFYQAVDSLFVYQLQQQLQAAGPRVVRYLGQAKAGSITQPVLDSLARRHPDLDGLLLCELVVRCDGSTLQASSPNTKVKLLLVERATGRAVGQIRFNTRMGKSYWLNPTVAAAIADATTGATKPLRRFISSSKP